VIGQVELAAVAIVAQIWLHAIAGRNVIIYIDNDSAREALIKGYSPAIPSAELIAVAWLGLAEARAAPWFARVPGPSNIADGPSRMQFKECADLGIERVQLSVGWERSLLWDSPGGS